MILTFEEVQRINCRRVGIIPYVKTSSGLHFLMGVDSRTKDLCDFGGRLEKGETNIQGAIREFMEESLEIVDASELRQMSCGIFDRRNNICIIFCEVLKPNFYENANTLFHTSTVNSGFEWGEEMSDIVWLSWDDMVENVYGSSSRFWSRVKYALSNCSDFNDELKEYL